MIIEIQIIEDEPRMGEMIIIFYNHVTPSGFGRR